MKLEVGMYVRTKKGCICKILRETYSKYLLKNKEFCYEVDKPINANCELYKENISKASHNIIDLIEVGDYVNGYKVYYCYCADEDMTGLFIDTETKRVWLDKPSQIKSIVTKEQFESMSYRTGSGE